MGAVGFCLEVVMGKLSDETLETSAALMRLSQIERKEGREWRGLAALADALLLAAILADKQGQAVIDAPLQTVRLAPDP
jgi:hypothetical protein